MAKIHCDWTASGFLIIPDEQYDPAVHRLYVAPAPAVEPTSAAAPTLDDNSAEDRSARRRRG